MANIEQLSAALIKADAAGNADDARALAGEIRKMQAAPAPAQQGVLSQVGQSLGDVAAGALRGFGSIGTTISGLTIDPLARATGLDKTGVGEVLGLGKTMKERRQGMDAGLANLGANTDSNSYTVGRIGGEVAGTLGAGPALGLGAKAAGVAAPLANALASSGMSTGVTVAKGAMPYAQNMLTRVAGGAAAGGVGAGMTDTANAGAGALIGGVLPPALAGLGLGANALGRFMSGPGVSQTVTSNAQTARAAGLVIPPTQANPTLSNRLLEGVAGKLTTAQKASATNAPTLNGMVAADLGLAKGEQITPEVLNAIRKQAGQSYEAVGTTGMITPGPGYEQALDKITVSAKQSAAGFPNAKPNPIIAEIESLKSPQFDAGSAVSKISDLRESADVAYRAGNKQLGGGLKSAANAIEDAIDAHLSQIGAAPELLTGFREARQLIAKTYSVQKALNETSGNVSAVNLAAQLKRGAPLSGGMLDAAKFGQQFPKAAQSVEQIGSQPGTSPLDLYGGVATAGVLPFARMVARATALSPMVQNRFPTAAGPNNALSELLNNRSAAQLLYRASPQAANP